MADYKKLYSAISGKICRVVAGYDKNQVYSISLLSPTASTLHSKTVKERDWYDMEWYIQKGIPLNLDYFLMRARDSGDWQKDTISETEFRELLKKKIDTVKMNYVINDIKRFIRNADALAIWSPDYFHDLVNSLKVV